MFSSLQGQSALVTCAAHGLGRGIASALARAGVKTLITDTDLDAGLALADELCSQGYIARFCRAEIRHRGQVDAALDDSLEYFEGLDILCPVINLAPHRPLDAFTDAEWQKRLDEGVSSAFTLIQAARSLLARSHSPRIVLTLGNADHNIACRAGLLGLAASIMPELAGSGITVNSVLAGPMHDDSLDADRHKALAAQIPLGRLACPEDIARAVLFLASREAAYITGQVLAVDGGLESQRRSFGASAV